MKSSLWISLLAYLWNMSNSEIECTREMEVRAVSQRNEYLAELPAFLGFCAFISVLALICFIV